MTSQPSDRGDRRIMERIGRLMTPDDITEAFVDRFYDECIDGYYDDEPVDWEEALLRAENYDNGIDFGDQMDSPAIRKLKREVRRIRRENGIGS